MFLTISSLEALTSSAAADICSICSDTIWMEDMILPRDLPASSASWAPSATSLVPSSVAFTDSLTPF